MSTPKKTRHTNQPLRPTDVNGVTQPPNRGHGLRPSGSPLKLGGFADLWRGQPAQAARPVKPAPSPQPAAPSAGSAEPPRLPLADAILGLQAAVQMNNSLLMDNNRLLADVIVRLDLNARLMSGSDLSSADMDIINSAHEDRDVVEEEVPSSEEVADKEDVASDLEQVPAAKKTDGQRVPAPKVSKGVSKVVQATEAKEALPYVEVAEGPSS